MQTALAAPPAAGFEAWTNRPFLHRQGTALEGDRRGSIKSCSRRAFSTPAPSEIRCVMGGRSGRKPIDPNSISMFGISKYVVLQSETAWCKLSAGPVIGGPCHDQLLVPTLWLDSCLCFVATPSCLRTRALQHDTEGVSVST